MRKESPVNNQKLRNFVQEKNPEEKLEVEAQQAALEAQFSERQADINEKTVRLQEKIKQKQLEFKEVIDRLKELESELESKQQRTLAKLFNLFEIRALQNEIQGDRRKVEDLQREFEGLWQMYKDLQKEADSKVELEKAESLISEFYKDQAEALETWEGEKKSKDVMEVCKEHNAVLNHSFLSMTTPGQVSVMKRGVRWQDMFHATLAMEPNLSTASVRLDKQKNEVKDQSFFSFGVLLKGGEIGAAMARDSVSQVSEGERSNVFNTENPKEEISQAINKSESGHNEILVKKPQIAALFFDSDIDVKIAENSALTEHGNKNLMDEILKEGKTLGMPVYIRDAQTGEYFLVEEVVTEKIVNEELEEVDRKRVKYNKKPMKIEDIVNNDFELSESQKNELIKDVLEGDIYNLDLPERNNFDSWSYAQQIYQSLSSKDKKHTFRLASDEGHWESQMGYSDANSYIVALEEIIALKQNEIEVIQAKIDRGEVKNEWGVDLAGLQDNFQKTLNKIGWHLWGVTEAANNENDAEIGEKAKTIAQSLVNEDQKDEILAKRLAKDGKFMIKKEDLKYMKSVG
ncbi:hypothetical protein HN858_04040 [Candidatus Falkowbacteria bacterium]|jgi:hypothetical protein|nr:hypothetical protein [Candidatus Falkowbacteria bacterium]MBT5502655.1 hypothetical protein [Candidatus Falkowbacteria bacterium]MBT6573542.1 hypothetical protein [Candidatus Falkowbacteria bacterium]MBT7348818.1 hypothetical protein [Candidatus Falkowbacteria bacterium]MBT7501215.1 hypothetical protein [Candidatus Falkowbacteria bacterium]